MSDSTLTIPFDVAIEGDAEATGRLDQLNGKITEVSAKTDEASKQTTSFTSTMKGSALGISAAASSATSLYFQFDNLDKMNTRVDQADKALTTSKASLITAQERLSELVNKGITGGADYEKAQLQLKAAQDGLTISQDKLNQATGDLSQAQLGFALQVVPTAISVVSTLTGVISSLRAVKLANAAATGAETATTIAGTGALGAFTFAAGGATAGTTALTVATKALQVMMGPPGWIILGIATAA